MTLAATDKPQIVYMFSPSCGWCERNLDNVAALIRHTADRYDFVAVAVDSRDLDKYVAERRLNWIVVREPSSTTRQAYHMGTTPMTIVVERGGKVSHVWLGAYNGKVADDVKATFGVTLPGLRQPKTG
jgi:peroxiredoxin